MMLRLIFRRMPPLVATFRFAESIAALRTCCTWWGCIDVSMEKHLHHPGPVGSSRCRHSIFIWGKHFFFSADIYSNANEFISLFALNGEEVNFLKIFVRKPTWRWRRRANGKAENVVLRRKSYLFYDFMMVFMIESIFRKFYDFLTHTQTHTNAYRFPTMELSMYL